MSPSSLESDKKSNQSNQNATAFHHQLNLNELRIVRYWKIACFRVMFSRLFSVAIMVGGGAGDDRKIA
jgi:hypothetical protein